MSEAIDHYKTLQVDPSALQEVIQGAYTKLAHLYHPDVNQSPDATAKMTEINIAYEVLSDPGNREEYDRRRATQTDSRANSEGRAPTEEEHSRNFEAYCHRAIEYFRREDFRRAIEHFDAAINLGLGYSRAYRNRGIAYARLGEHHRAISDYGRAISLDPNDSQAYNARGVAYAKLGEHHRAISDYGRAISLDPNDSQAYNARGVAYAELGEHHRAISDYGRAISLDPNDSQAYKARGVAYAKLGEHHRAISDYGRAISLDPNDSQAYNARGVAYAKLGEHHRAISDYGRAISLDPNDSQAYNARGVAYAKLGEHHRAISDYGRAISLDPNDSQAYNARGVAYAKLGEHHRAISDYGRAISLDPNDSQAYNARGVAYAKLGEHHRAISDYGRAISLDPDFTAAYRNKRKSESMLLEKQETEVNVPEASVTIAKPVARAIVATLNNPAAIIGIGTLLTALGLFVSLRYAPVFTIMLTGGACGMGMGLHELRRKKTKKNRMKPKHMWALIAVSAVFLATGLFSMLNISPIPTLVTLGGTAVIGVGLTQLILKRKLRKNRRTS